MFPPIPRIFEVFCKKHGKLGEVYSAVMGMILFTGHSEQMTDDCGGCEIIPKHKDYLDEDPFSGCNPT